MPKLPVLNARQVVRALKRAGFVEDRQKGSHLILVHGDTKARTIVPIHSGRTIKERCYEPLFETPILRSTNLSACSERLLKDLIGGATLQKDRQPDD